MNRIIFCLMLITFSIKAFSANFGCEAYHLSPSNTLAGVSVFNARYIGDKYTAELAPSNENQQSNIIIQYWYLDAYRDTKLFVKCIYKNNTYITKEIPQSVNTCKFKFLDNTKKRQSTQKPDFKCYQRGEKDGKCSPKA